MPHTAPAPLPDPWWQRLHNALMPDYNRQASACWWLVVTAGAALWLWCLGWLLAQPWWVALQVAGGVGLAVGAGLFPVRVPGTKHSYAAGEIFIFLVLLVHGPQAAAVVAGVEAAIGACRTSKRWTSRCFSPASAALAMVATGSLLQPSLSRLELSEWAGAAPLLAITMAFAVAYFFVNAVLQAGVLRLKRSAPFLQVLDIFSALRWVGLAYAGSASVATLLFVTYRQQGSGVLMVMLPLLALLLVSLHLYFREQEASRALRAASTAVAERDSALAAREAETAARHLQALQASEQRFHSAFEHAAIGMALLDFGGRILQANAALATLLGVAEEELAQQHFQDFVQAEDRAALSQRLGLADQREFEAFAQELHCRHRDGSSVWLALHCSFFTEPDAGLVPPASAAPVPAPAPPPEAAVAAPGRASSGRPCLILQAQDVSLRRRAEAGLAHLAYHDSLTGLPNRRRFLECLAGAVSRYKNDPKHPWAVMFIDFDRFKLVNDNLGHNAGDELLIQLSRRVQERLRPSDILARLGGDEFAILADHIEHERDVVVLAERLMDALRRPFLLGDVELIASASIGITFSALGYDTAEEALRDADTALYAAKDAGKARYAIFDTSLHAVVSERLRLQGELRHAIDRGELAVEYQPVFALGSGTAVGMLSGFEALVRWRHPQDGMLQPASFLPIAEESGLMLQLSDFVLHCACRQLRAWQLADPALSGLTMSINLSAQDLAHPALVARVGRAIVEADLRPEHLTLELTETILMAQMDGAGQALADLRRLGVQLAVDDFGSGYSSLGQLSRLPIDSLKIDRSFISHLQRGSDAAALVDAIIQLGRSLRKTVIAEGIESADQMQQLCALGCAYGQGFHLAPPMSEQAAGAWLRERRGQLP